MASTVRDVMTSDPICLTPDATLTEAARHMRDSDIGDVLVVEKGRLQGIITDRDIAVRAVADGLDPRSAKISQIVSGPVHTIASTDQISDAVSMMRKHALRRLPVCEGDRPVGIVSIGDLALEQDRTSALADISGAPPSR
ncbi:oxidoreductase [Pilimelia terevasa]|uniref:Oxidoreductase n=1 Tax=Pilimelia terevasa TaxID=53372 RepID=A0A8J3FDS3_9ACTN|nr:CBS domain-containing protein [Pilimelia terevasa]GGK13977.1 oxidoreductase [Pilimelia terevasa]